MSEKEQRPRHRLIVLQREARKRAAGFYHRVVKGENYNSNGARLEAGDVVRHATPKDRFGNKLPTNRKEAREAVRQFKRRNKRAAGRTAKQQSDTERFLQRELADFRKKRLVPMKGELVKPAGAESGLIKKATKKIWTPKDRTA